jgi:c-di-GMP-binding flagellar brake protein YcgR
MAGQKFDERREYVRVSLTTKAKVQPVSREEFERHKTMQVSGQTGDVCPDGSDVSNGQLGYLIQRLIRIEEKVDRILSKLDPETKPDEVVTYGTSQNISGAGVSLSLNEALEAGQLVLISLSVPGFSIGFLEAYGEVVRVSEDKGTDRRLFNTSIKFLIIDENEREKLISYAFYRQRQEIRSQAGGNK